MKKREAFHLPLLCKEGKGEVDPPWLYPTYPPLYEPSAYKGEANRVDQIFKDACLCVARRQGRGEILQSMSILFRDP